MIREYLPGAFRISALMLLLGTLLCLSSSAQDLIKLKSGKELRVTVINESTDVIRYRDYDDPSGPVYTVKKDLVESVKYKKGSKPEQTDTRNKEKDRAGGNEIITPGTQISRLTMKKQLILLDGKPQSPRDVKALMEDYPDILAVYEKGKKEYSASYSCLMGSLLVDLVTTLLMNPKKTQEEKLKIGIPGLSVSGGLIVTGIVLAIDGKKKVKRSVSMYNAAIAKPGTCKIDFGIQKNGIMMAVRF